jgi:hypothetical protein
VKRHPVIAYRLIPERSLYCTWDSVTDAASDMGVSRSTIHRAIRTGRPCGFFAYERGADPRITKKRCPTCGVELDLQCFGWRKTKKLDANGQIIAHLTSSCKICRNMKQKIRDRSKARNGKV